MGAGMAARRKAQRIKKAARWRVEACSLGGGGNEAYHEAAAGVSRNPTLNNCPAATSFKFELKPQSLEPLNTSRRTRLDPGAVRRPQTACGRHCPWEPTALRHRMTVLGSPLSPYWRLMRSLKRS